jgi:serine/threonine protein kinase
MQSLEIIGRLGRGSTAHVLKTQAIRSKKYYAMKVVEKAGSEDRRAAVLREIDIHGRLRSEHVCRLVAHFQDEANHYIVTEYCKDGELTNLLLRPVGEQQLLEVLTQVGSALRYLH